MPPGGPPPTSKLPWIIGAVLLVLVILVAAVVMLAGGSDKSDNKPSSTPGKPGVSTSASEAPAEGITYEITGSSRGSLTVTYIGADGVVDETVSSLPWSVTVSPEPMFPSIFAVPSDFSEMPDITFTIKRGGEVLKKCDGMTPCAVLSS
ncbi:hypothetical protein A5643_10345 [Mycobacterium sp. 1274756.6]|nr:hypothetical protein A5643_10345 [Mycobacterium sp. 1274756.6]